MMKTEKKENVKNTRRTFRDLQSAAKDKENLAGRPQIVKDPKAFVEADKTQQQIRTKQKSRKVLMINKSIQTGECTITAQDLISNEPSSDYWKRLAEKRQESLENSLRENDILKENIATLKEENRICKEMLEESKHLVEVLKEMLAEHVEEDKDEKEQSEAEVN